ncbi:phosphoglycerate mutase [Peptoclostridium acidaminophilum DSM 3953]|uniref:Phosphoglycerate mutase n=1 Tax=Peptoclostridium acidaminophilum DSM 3953 TaxID=1286171 RepID=W8T6U3_PEPAC|nr:histidine phosphatase family protein [Peptoclostridium acidaminophilum]AHM56600.1 phosphoglycerate mutase [Peptoclostridium acidaminophilum DSM 3953]
MKRIYLTRHGQTEWNVQKRFQGHRDSNLTEMGVRQAQWLRDYMKNKPIDRVYSSPLPRAYTTAQIVTEGMDIEIERRDGLKEMNFGVWEGMSESDIKESSAEQLHNFWNRPHMFEPVGGESYEEASKRITEEFEDIVKSSSGSNLLMVVHGVVLKLILLHAENGCMEDLWQPPFVHPASLSILEYDERQDSYRVIKKSDISHYKDQI